jgi:hypothetical protein
MPPDPPTPPGAPNARRALLGGLAMALKLLAQRILPQADTAHEVAELAARAEELAAEAWKLGASRVPEPARAAALQAEFQAFIEGAAELSARAAHAAAAVRVVGEAIETHGTALSSLAQSPEADDLAVLRTRLRPMLATLEQLPDRLAASTALAEDVAAMGTNAARLGGEAMAAQGHRIPAGEKALALYRSLRAIGQQAGTVAETLVAEGQGLRGTIGRIASHVGQIATGTAQPTAESRLTQVVAAGTGTPTPPADALDWATRR